MRRLPLNRFLVATSGRALLGAIFIAVFSVLTLAVQIRSGHAEAALAFGSDNTGRYWYGTSWNYETKDEARGAAMQRCLQRGGHCQVVWQTNNGCIALATGNSGNAAGYVSRATKEEAQRAAIGACVEANKGYACTIRTVFCDDVSEDALRAQREAQLEQQRREAEKLREEGNQQREVAQSGVKCENGRFCNAGEKCASNGACIPQDAVDCGTWRCKAGYKCASGNSCIPEANVDCGPGSNFSCRWGTTCSRDGKRCVAKNEIDCGSFICTEGHTCGSGGNCVPIVRSDNAKPTAIGLPNIEDRPVRRNYHRVIETLREIGAWITGGAAKPFPSMPVDVLVICGGAVLAVGLLLIEAMYRFLKRQRGRQERKEPELPKTGSAPSEGHAASSVAPEHEVPSTSEHSSEHRDAAGVSEPSTVHDSLWAVHSKAGVKKSPQDERDVALEIDRGADKVRGEVSSIAIVASDHEIESRKAESHSSN